MSDFYVGAVVDSKGGNFSKGTIEELWEERGMEIAVVYWHIQDFRQQRATSTLYLRY